jgi:hypothetical protein
MNLSLSNTASSDKVQIEPQAIRGELARILDSPIFVQSNRLARFLRFTVEIALAGEGATLKEYLIGTEVYDRKPPYHPSVDSIVRSEARRLRTKLRQYYESGGKDDPVFIYYRTGSYVPVFRQHRENNRGLVPANRHFNELVAEGLMQLMPDHSSANQKVQVQIIFEGTIRMVRSEPECSGERHELAPTELGSTDCSERKGKHEPHQKNHSLFFPSACRPVRLRQRRQK